MTGIHAFLSDDHRACDRLFADMEQALADGTLDAARSAFGNFVHDMERHFQREEGVLFPRFEQATGLREGPTRMMRIEHDQMRGLMQDLAEALGQGDRATGLGLAETLMVMIQQHNLKEERVLYPLAERHLGAQAREIVERLAGFGSERP